MASAHALRLVSALEQWNFIGAFERYLPAYMVAGSLVWSTLGFILAWGLWRGQNWAIRMLKSVAVAYSLYYWLDRLLISNAPPNNLPFAATLNLAVLVVILWILSRRNTKIFFGVVYGDRSQNPRTS
jgi:hypothetical protein